VPVDPANARQLVQIASEVGADVLTGDLRYPSETGGWQLGKLDLSEYVDRYRNQRLVIIIAPLGPSDPMTYTCGTCGFVMNEAGECPRCKLASAQDWLIPPAHDEVQDILDQVRAALDCTNDKNSRHESQ